jgi:hypothetical protein
VVVLLAGFAWGLEPADDPEAAHGHGGHGHEGNGSNGHDGDDGHDGDGEAAEPAAAGVGVGEKGSDDE